MNVFIDTNIFLNFYYFSKEELNSLKEIFKSNQSGGVKVILTEQVRNEFYRNRENKIAQALKAFRVNELQISMPYFMKEYEEFNKLSEGVRALQILKNALDDKVVKDIIEMNLKADKFMNDIFSDNEVIEIKEEIFVKAEKRHKLRNPPGKNDSMGDAINWEIILDRVPANEEIHIISNDGDYESKFNDKKLDSFLEKEWVTLKSSEIFFYKTLTDFTSRHFNGVSFSFDTEKKALLIALASSPAFKVTHSIISELEKYENFSLNEVETVLDACVNNSQISWILDDKDIYEFIHKITYSKQSEIKNPEYKRVINEVQNYCKK